MEENQGMEHPLVALIRKQDRRALARALTYIVDEHEEKDWLLDSLHPYASGARVVGFTGSPGAGKSTLVDQVIRYLRDQGEIVGVLAVDPSSPFSGGSLLGDRVRMNRHSGDPGVFIRSVSNRGARGGMAFATREMLTALSAYGCNTILLETVGVGQAELDVLHVADTTVLVLTPGAGDAVQTAKAGIMEIGDVFAVNKADEVGAASMYRALRLLVHERTLWRNDWPPPIVKTIATSGDGVEALWQSVIDHARHMKHRPDDEQREQVRRRTHVLDLLEGTMRERLARWIDKDRNAQHLLLERLDLSPHQVAKQLLSYFDNDEYKDG